MYRQQHDTEFGVRAVEQIIKGSKKYQADKKPDEKIILWVVSTCEYFTKEAQSLAKQYNVRLIDGKELATMLISQFGKMNELDK